MFQTLVVLLISAHSHLDTNTYMYIYQALCWQERWHRFIYRRWVHLAFSWCVPATTSHVTVVVTNLHPLASGFHLGPTMVAAEINDGSRSQDTSCAGDGCKRRHTCITSFSAWHEAYTAYPNMSTPNKCVHIYIYAHANKYPTRKQHTSKVLVQASQTQHNTTYAIVKTVRDLGVGWAFNQHSRDHRKLLEQRNKDAQI